MLAPALVVAHAPQCAGKDAGGATGGTHRASSPGMFGLIRRFIVGWLLIRLVRRLAGGSARAARRGTETR